MHSHRRPRAGNLLEVLCALTIAASFVLASRQTGAWAFLGSATVFALLGLYWSSSLFARDAVAVAAQPVPEAEETIVPIAAEPDEAPTESQVEVVANNADVLIDSEPLLDPEPAPKAPAKRRARKARAAKAGDGPAVEPTQAAAAYEPAPSGPPIEPLFDPQPFARQIRPAFGRRAGGSKPLSA